MVPLFRRIWQELPYIIATAEQSCCRPIYRSRQRWSLTREKVTPIEMPPNLITIHTSAVAVDPSPRFSDERVATNRATLCMQHHSWMRTDSGKPQVARGCTCTCTHEGGRGG
ncbi:hypothetical protein BS78_10G226000 [Paspalum vaginatum]|nr:hypothetical protein BS78_10G226000 [Paspalum vaginatum]